MGRACLRTAWAGPTTENRKEATRKEYQLSGRGHSVPEVLRESDRRTQNTLCGEGIGRDDGATLERRRREYKKLAAGSLNMLL